MTTASVKEQASRRNTTINLRVPKAVRDLIDAAAETTGKSRTEFMLESARQSAIDVLLDQRFFSLTSSQWKAFTQALDNPAPPNEALRALMAKAAPWEA